MPTEKQLISITPTFGRVHESFTRLERKLRENREHSLQSVVFCNPEQWAAESWRHDGAVWEDRELSENIRRDRMYTQEAVLSCLAYLADTKIPAVQIQPIQTDDRISTIVNPDRFDVNADILMAITRAGIVPVMSSLVQSPKGIIMNVVDPISFAREIARQITAELVEI